MKRKTRLMIAMLCAFAMIGDSAAVFAQGQDKQQETTTKKQVFIGQDGKVVEVPSGGVWVGGQGQEGRVHFTFSDSAGFVTSDHHAPQVQFMHNEFHFDSKVVKGMPYSADAVTETIQTMGDGNRIVRNSSAKMYRDSAGRTRREQALSAVGGWSVAGDSPTMIYISDPVSGVHYTLNANTRTANKVAVHRVTAAGEGKVYSYSVSDGSSKVSVKSEGSGDQVKFVTDDNKTIILSGDGSAKAVAELKASKGARVVSGSTGVVSSGAGVVSGVATAGERVWTFASEGEVNRESLGAQTVEGVQAEGTRITFTIPAGKIGNERPIVTVNERWYSPELQAVVMSKNSDPRSGETTYRLTNINRSEPDPSLFQVPADYTIKENTFSSSKAAEMLKKIEAERKAKKPNEN
ncbi:MAG: hypothetical protein ACREBD_00710 [Blastocatellia bacterium]